MPSIAATIEDLEAKLAKARAEQAAEDAAERIAYFEAKLEKLKDRAAKIRGKVKALKAGQPA